MTSHLCFAEISVAPSRGEAQNFGWLNLEGPHEFLGPVLGLDGEPEDDVDVADVGRLSQDRVEPVLEYARADDHCSVAAAWFYPGSAMPDLYGTYLWADLCDHAIHTLRSAADRWVAGRLGCDVYLVSLNDGLDEITTASAG